MPLSINDGKGTPVAHVFTQDAQQNGADPSEFVNRSNPNGPNFWERLTGLVTAVARGVSTRSGGRAHVYKLKLNRPIPGTDASGNPIVRGTHEAILTLLIDPAVANESDILDTFVMVANLGDNATVRTQVKQLAPLLVS